MLRIQTRKSPGVLEAALIKPQEAPFQEIKKVERTLSKEYSEAADELLREVLPPGRKRAKGIKYFSTNHFLKLQDGRYPVY